MLRKHSTAAVNVATALESSREMRDLVSYLKNEADFVTKFDVQATGIKFGMYVGGAVAGVGTALVGLSQYIIYNQLNKMTQEIKAVKAELKAELTAVKAEVTAAEARILLEVAKMTANKEGKIS